MQRILIIEDELSIAELERDYLEVNGYESDIAITGEEGFRKAMTNTYSLILLDLMLPGIDGFELCKQLRETLDIPILMVTARKEDIDKIRGFDRGADDYIVKPFAIEELLARLRALLRRIDIEGDKNIIKQTTLTYRDLTIEKENRVVRRGTEMIELTKREYELLLTLMENINVVLARDVLLNKVWGYETEVETNVVDVYIRYLRNKIDVPGDESYIQTVRGTGYVMRS